MEEKKDIDELLKLYNEKDFKTTIINGLSLSKIYPQNPIIFNIIGLSYINIKEYSNALSIFNELTINFPNNAEAYINIGIIQRALGKNDEAIKFYNKSLKINPKSYNVNSQNLKEFYHDVGQFCWGTPKAWIKKKKVFSKNTKVLKIPNYRAIDIDNHDDLKLAKLIYKSIF